MAQPPMPDMPSRLAAGSPSKGQQGQPQLPGQMTDDDRAARLDSFGQSLAKTRSEAIAARQSSGIEDVWREDEEFYEGVDDMNRGEERATWRQKPMAQAGYTTKQTTQQKRSTIFPNITGPFVDCASARISDMLLPTDDRGWGLSPTPIPDLVDIAQGNFPGQLISQMQQEHPGEGQAAGALGNIKAQAQQTLEIAKARARRAEKQIEDWHVECQWHAQVRLVIEDSARIGTGILKGPIPMYKKSVAVTQGKLEITQKLYPGSKWVDPWNFYPDAACGEDIHNGSYTWERDYLTRKQLRELKGRKNYISDQIDACLQEGPMQVTQEYKETPEPVRDPAMMNKYQIWYFYGTAEKEDIEAAGCDCGDDPDPHLPCIVTMVNNRVVRVSLNPLDTGDFPYDVMIWRRRAGHWAGIGVARQIRVPQKIVTAASRNMMDNAGVAAGPMLVFHQGAVVPADGVAGLAPRKIFYIAEEVDEMIDATKAIGVIKVDMMVNELMAIIKWGMEMAESVTNMPMILQGQMGQSAPDTLGGQQLFMNNASTVLRRLARLFDDRVTEPNIRRTYYWLLQYSDDEQAKGDLTIDAKGSSALVEREIQNQELLQMGQMILDPRYGKDPKKWMDEYLKSRHFDVARFNYDDQQWQKIVENLSQPQDPKLQIAQMKDNMDKYKTDMDAQLKHLALQVSQQEAQADREMEIILKELDAHLAGAKLTGDRQINLDNIKQKLTDTVMKARTQMAMQAADHHHSTVSDQLMSPPTEPPGRAQPGHSYEQ